MSVEEIVINSAPLYFHGKHVAYLSPAVPDKWLVCLNSDETVFKISHVLSNGHEREIFGSEDWTPNRNAFVGAEAARRTKAFLDSLLAP